MRRHPRNPGQLFVSRALLSSSDLLHNSGPWSSHSWRIGDCEGRDGFEASASISASLRRHGSARQAARLLCSWHASTRTRRENKTALTTKILQRTAEFGEALCRSNAVLMTSLVKHMPPHAVLGVWNTLSCVVQSPVLRTSRACMGYSHGPVSISRAPEGDPHR
jgi:hypothetical protein